MEPPLRLDRIRQIAIPVRNLGEARRFYEDLLGLRFLFEAPPSLAFLDCGGVRLMLDGNSEEGQTASVLYYPVSDLESAVAALEERGVSFVAEPHLVAKLPDHELWMAFLRDPSGNLLALMSEVPTRKL